MRCVMPISACVFMSLAVGPALARDHSHRHRHVEASKHAHHASRSHARHAHRWRHHRQVVLRRAYEQPAPFAFEPGAAPAFPAAWQRSAAWKRQAARQLSAAWQQPATWQPPAAQPMAPTAWAPPAAPAPRSPVQGQLSSMVVAHAQANGLPPSLVHRVIMRESRYNPRAVSRGNYGLMQIRLGTARAMGYGGSAAGLLDANTNMTYAVRYLAGAYRAAGGNPNRAVAYYARGYHQRTARRGSDAYAMMRPYGASPATMAPVSFVTPPRPEIF